MITRYAKHSDYSEMLRITSAARAFLAELGLDQWAGGWPTPEVLQSDIERGVALLVVGEDDSVLGVCAAICAPEPDYDNIQAGSWLLDLPNNDDDGPARYLVVHRLAVAPEARGQGVATFLLRDAARLAREQGMESVRVDTHPGNAAMQRTIQKAGYTRCCDILITSEFEPTKERIGYELAL